ncbi:hypothetical protein [Reinekea thalattae]|uniref:Uncharacterized protein n=1 Tax=Reinekea thalattae TaxID=2593301 RepID=A0A5C8Z7X0_9GAMM|nr:hypothetical protein [Reinekea thalattae]TXR53419.1 hypothetical protein FME95_02290 [Reinekea thalattae]
MSRSRKSRRMKDRVGIKTGSKKDFIKQGEMGKIPSHNRLAKHKKKQKSAYQRYLAENNLADTSAGQQKVRERLKKAEDTRLAVDTKQRKEDKPTKDFDQLSGDELLQLFN